MAGSPLFGSGPDPYGGAVKHAASTADRGGSSHTMFLVWVALIGIVLPALILGGLKMGGFSFVFRGR